MTTYEATNKSEAIHDALEHISAGRSQEDIWQGFAYSTGKLKQGLTGSSTTNFVLRNPAGSGKIVFATSRVNSTGKVYTYKQTGVTIDTSGTTQPIRNRRLSDGASVCDAQFEPVTSGGDQWSKKVAGAGDGPPQQLAPGSVTDIGVMLEPGDTVEIVIENGTANTIDVNTDIDYLEVPVDNYQA